MQKTPLNLKFIIAISSLITAVVLFVIFFFAIVTGDGSLYMLGVASMPLLILSFVLFSMARHEPGRIGSIAGIIKKVMLVIVDIPLAFFVFGTPASIFLWFFFPSKESHSYIGIYLNTFGNIVWGIVVLGAFVFLLRLQRIIFPSKPVGKSLWIIIAVMLSAVLLSVVVFTLLRVVFGLSI